MGRDYHAHKTGMIIMHMEVACMGERFLSAGVTQDGNVGQDLDILTNSRACMSVTHTLPRLDLTATEANKKPARTSQQGPAPQGLSHILAKALA